MELATRMVMYVWWLAVRRVRIGTRKAAAWQARKVLTIAFLMYVIMETNASLSLSGWSSPASSAWRVRAPTTTSAACDAVRTLNAQLLLYRAEDGVHQIDRDDVGAGARSRADWDDVGAGARSRAERAQPGELSPRLAALVPSAHERLGAVGPVAAREVEGRLAASVEQHLQHDLVLVAAERHHERLPHGAERVDVHATIDQPLDRTEVAELRGC